MDEPVRGHFPTIRKGHPRGVGKWNPDWRRNSIYHAIHMCGKLNILSSLIKNS